MVPLHTVIFTFETGPWQGKGQFAVGRIQDCEVRNSD